MRADVAPSRIRLRRRAMTVLAMLLSLAAIPAEAHLMPAGQGTLRLVGPTAWLALAVPVSALDGWDDDRDGRMAPRELQAHAAALQAQLRERVVLRDGADRGRIGYEDLLWSEAGGVGGSVDGDGHAGGGGPAGAPATFAAPAALDTLVLLRQVTWSQGPTAPTLRVDLFDRASGAAAQLSLRALQRERVDVAVFDAGHAERRLFRPPGRVFVDYVATGAAHILGGFDHLLFLLTVLVAGAGWRWWAGVITTFTVAHSLTLALAANGVVRVDASIVEPGIAASIALMAAANLWLGAARPRARLVLVFGCGLLHGLGFAGAIDTLGASGAARLASLAGFNVGVELGQAAFVAVALGTLALLRRAIQAGRAGEGLPPARVARAVAAVALGGGVLMLAQRLG